jgi:hypothetical protein
MTDAWRRWAWPVSIATVAVTVRLVFFTGLQGNDDYIYSRAAYLVAGGEAPWVNCLTLRWGYILPVALLYAVFGVRVACLVAPNLAASLLLVGLAYRFGRDLYSVREGRVAALFVALLPLDVYYATESHADLPMTALVMLALYLLWASLRQQDAKAGRLRALWAGAAFGAAHLTKESALIFLVPAAAFLASRRNWPRLAVAAAGAGGVLVAEAVAYAVIAGDPFLRVRCARAAQEGMTPGSPFSRLLDVLSFCFNPAGVGFVYTGGLFWLAGAGAVWALWRDRAASEWVAFGWLGTAAVIALWPITLFPYRPAMILHPRVYAPLELFSALLAARVFVAGAQARWPRVSWAGAAGFGLLALFAASRVHDDAVRVRTGAQWAHAALSGHRGARVIADHRTAEIVRILGRYALPYELGEFGAGDPAPPAGTLLLDNERWVATQAFWDRLPPPPWWRTPPPPRETLAELVVPPRRSWRGPSGAPERVRLSRVLAAP